MKKNKLLQLMKYDKKLVLEEVEKLLTQNKIEEAQEMIVVTKVIIDKKDISLINRDKIKITESFEEEKETIKKLVLSLEKDKNNLKYTHSMLSVCISFLAIMIVLFTVRMFGINLISNCFIILITFSNVAIINHFKKINNEDIKKIDKIINNSSQDDNKRIY